VNGTWHDGDSRPPKEIMELVALPAPPDQTPAAKKRADSLLDQGSILIGTEGVLHVPHIAMPKLFPLEKFHDYKLPEITGTHHWSDWAEACVGGPGKPTAGFDYSGPLTEAVLLGSVAVRFPQTTLEWNSAKLQFTNEKSANTFVRRSYRKGWEVAGL
jgi:hypothetical protein